MKFTQIFIWIAFVLKIVIAEVATDGKDMKSCFCDENILNLILNKLNAMDEKVDMIDFKTQIKLELQDLRNAIDGFNQTLRSIANYVGPAYENCAIALQTTASNGVYRLKHSFPNLSPLDAYCLKDPDGGLAWTVIQRRQDGSVSFYRNWEDYKHGFGVPSGEYWIGLENIYALTSKQKYELWIELGDHEGKRRYAKYSAFEIGNEDEEYYLKTVGEYTGNAGHSLGDAGEERIFLTYDTNLRLAWNSSCEVFYENTWWFDNCNSSSLNGEYNNDHHGEGINWYTWYGLSYSLKYAHMAIRPVNQTTD